ncbi:hypothetical protein INT80_14100 [Gallibacterium anatis]|uniref:Maltose transporter permease n=1 Tax=Gallibacterium anatis TaxID=750 RepID=A0A930UUP4_9PAST|nr:hypothetical protein [Gallibacterium anatis]
MAIVQAKSLRYRLWATHLFLIAFIALIMFPLLMVVGISLRPGNLALGEIIPNEISWEHWKLALGFDVVHSDGSITPPPFPVLLWLWNSESGNPHLCWDCCTLDYFVLTPLQE